MIAEKDPEKAKRLVRKESPPVIILARDDSYNRKLLEYGNFDILLSPESGSRKAGLKSTDSGLNHVLARIASRNRISIGIDLAEIRLLGKKEKAERLSRISQNIRICRKAKARIKVLNAESRQHAFSLLISLGASAAQAREAIDF